MNTQRELDLAQLDAQLTIKKLVEEWSKNFFRQLAAPPRPVEQTNLSSEELPPVEGTY